MTRKLIICTAGQTIQLALSAGTYMSWNLRCTALFPPPSATVMNVKKHARPGVVRKGKIGTEMTALTSWRE